MAKPQKLELTWICKDEQNPENIKQWPEEVERKMVFLLGGKDL